MLHLLKEVLRVSISISLLLICTFPVLFPFIVDFDDTFQEIFGYVIAFLYVLFMGKYGYNWLKHLLNNSVLFKWLMSDGSDLIFMIKEKRKINHKSPQKKVCIKYIENEFENIKSQNELLKIEIDEILDNSKNRIHNSEDIDAMIDAGKSHASIVYRVAEYSCRWKLISGELHVYRGVLGMGAGGYMTLWEILVSRLASVDGLTQDDIDLKRRNLREGIAQAG